MHTEAAIAALVGMLSARTEMVRVAAAEALLSRAWGKPMVETAHEQREYIETQTALLRAKLKEVEAGGSVGQTAINVGVMTWQEKPKVEPENE